MKLTYQGITICLLFVATRIVAEMDYFSSPGPNSHYKSGDTISFVVEDMPDEDDKDVNANLYKADHTLVKTLQTWNSQNVDESGEEFPFQWLVDVTESGQYYVEISVGASRDDVTQSYPFTIEVDEEEEMPIEEATTTDDVSQADPSQSDYAQQTTEEKSTPHKTSKLSLHNKQSKVAHILSHSDIDALSDEPSSDNQSTTDVNDKLQPQSKLAQLASSLASDLSLGQSHHPPVEPLMPKTSPTADMKELAAADDIAVAREKAWIAQQNQMDAVNSKTPSKNLKAAGKLKHQHSKIQKEIINQAKKGKAQAQKAKQQEIERQKLTLAQQEALDDKKTKQAAAASSSSDHHASKHTNTNHKATPHDKQSSKQKREAYRIIKRNLAKFSKQELQ